MFFQDNNSQQLISADTLYLVQSWVEENTKDDAEPNVFWKLYKGTTTNRNKEIAKNFDKNRADIDSSFVYLEKSVSDYYRQSQGRVNQYTLKLMRNDRDPTPREIPINISNTMGLATLGSAGANQGGFQNNPMMQMMQMMAFAKEINGSTNANDAVLQQQINNLKIEQLKLEHKHEIEKLQNDLSEPMSVWEEIATDKEVKGAIAFGAKEFGRTLAANMRRGNGTIAKSGGTAAKPERKEVEAKETAPKEEKTETVTTQNSNSNITDTFCFNTVIDAASAWHNADSEAMSIIQILSDIAVNQPDDYAMMKIALMSRFGEQAEEIKKIVEEGANDE